MNTPALDLKVWTFRYRIGVAYLLGGRDDDDHHQQSMPDGGNFDNSAPHN